MRNNWNVPVGTIAVKLLGTIIRHVVLFIAQPVQIVTMDSWRPLDGKTFRLSDLSRCYPHSAPTYHQLIYFALVLGSLRPCLQFAYISVNYYGCQRSRSCLLYILAIRLNHRRHYYPLTSTINRNWNLSIYQTFSRFSFSMFELGKSGEWNTSGRLEPLMD